MGDKVKLVTSDGSVYFYNKSDLEKLEKFRQEKYGGVLDETLKEIEPPVLEPCGPFKDGKARRRERRKQERLKNKKK